MISDLLIENIKAGALEEGFSLDDVELNITYPILCDTAFLGEGFIDIIGFSAGFDALWFRDDMVYVMLYSVYYTAEKQDLLPLAREIENRLNQYYQ